MADKNENGWRQGSKNGAGSKYEGRQGLITMAARTCFERKGVARTSIADITREVDITRELFYYYFPNKAAVVDAVMDTFIDDAKNLLSSATEDHDEVSENEDNESKMSVTAAVGALRAWVASDAGATLPMTELLRETGRWAPVSSLVAEQAISALRSAGVRLSTKSPASTLALRAALMGVMAILLFDEEVLDADLAEGLMLLLV